MQLSVLASQESYRQHVRPIWDALKDEERGCFTESANKAPQESPLWLTASMRDYDAIRHRVGAKAHMEHGCGLEGYGHGTLRRLNGAMLLAPNDFVAALYEGHSGPVEVVGTPKMDALSWIPTPAHEVIAVSFHWSGVVHGHQNVMETYAEGLSELAATQHVLGHAHPRAWGVAEPIYERLGIEPVQCFEDVVSRAFVYCVDHSSTAYEWAALGRPVVLMERGGTLAVPSPTGLRYEHYADIGPHVTPETLPEVAAAALDGDPEHAQHRRDASAALFPYLGDSTARTVAILRSL